METYKKPSDAKPARPVLHALLRVVLGTMLVGGLLIFAMALLSVASSNTGSFISQTVTWLLAGDKPQVTWYITRAAGLTAYLLLWLSTAWGLAVSNRILDGRLHGVYTYDFHQFISLLSIAFIALHVVILMFDQYAPFSLVQILFPFISTYRPGWVGLGGLSLYIILLVTITFYLRDRIGSKTFRSIHVLSLLGFLGSAVHGLYSGADSPLPAVQIMYALTFSSVIFLTAYWLAALYLKRRSATNRVKAPAQSSLSSSRR